MLMISVWAFVEINQQFMRSKSHGVWHLPTLIGLKCDALAESQLA